MARSFDDTTRRNIASRCAAFTRVPSVAGAELKRAAVAIALTEAEAGGGTTFLLTRRAATFRSHAAQWGLPGGRCVNFTRNLVSASVRAMCSACSTIIRRDQAISLRPWWSG